MNPKNFLYGNDSKNKKEKKLPFTIDIDNSFKVKELDINSLNDEDKIYSKKQLNYLIKLLDKRDKKSYSEAEIKALLYLLGYTLIKISDNRYRIIKNFKPIEIVF